MNLSPSELVENAIEALDKRGHCKGTLEDIQGRVCTMGALYVAAVKANVYGSSYQVARRACFDKLGNVASWNDAPERTAEEVRDFLMSVAKDFRNEGK